MMATATKARSAARSLRVVFKIREEITQVIIAVSGGFGAALLCGLRRCLSGGLRFTLELFDQDSQAFDGHRRTSAGKTRSSRGSS
jgi:hypothetical protein